MDIKSEINLSQNQYNSNEDELSQKPLMWRIKDKSDKDDIWPKKLLGHSILFVEEEKKFFCLGGNFNFYENFLRNIEFTTRLIKEVNKDIENFNKFDNEKLRYLNETISYYNNLKYIEVFSYDISKIKT